MEARVANSTIRIKLGDITYESADAIVNAANKQLGGSTAGVNGAIIRAAGPTIEEECAKIRNKFGGCETGKAVHTSAGDLAAKYVIHAVGPIYEGGTNNEAQLLASAYSESLKLAESLGCKSIAFPSLSTGIFNYPVREAAEIAMKTVVAHLNSGSSLQKVVFVLFDQSSCKEFTFALKKELA